MMSILVITVPIFSVSQDNRKTFLWQFASQALPAREPSLLLKWTDEDKTRDPQSTMLGAPLETASDLHSDLQHKYVR